MKLTERYRRLTLWNKLAVWGALASIVALVYAFLPDRDKDAVNVESGRDSVVITDSTIIFKRAEPSADTGVEGRTERPAGEVLTGNKAPAEVSAISLGEFFERQDALEGRFLELDEFLEQLRGREISWRGFVVHVTGDRMRIRAKGDGLSRRGAWVTLGADWRAKLASLRKGDLVEIRGLFQSGGPIWANINGLSFSVVAPREETAAQQADAADGASHRR